MNKYFGVTKRKVFGGYLIWLLWVTLWVSRDGVLLDLKGLNTPFFRWRFELAWSNGLTISMQTRGGSYKRIWGKNNE